MGVRQRNLERKQKRREAFHLFAQFRDAVHSQRKRADGRKKKLSKKHRLRLELLMSQLCRCYWCDRPFDTATATGRRDITLDHYIPRSKGGGWRGNVVLACAKCNHERGDRMINPVTQEILDTNRLDSKLAA